MTTLITIATLASPLALIGCSASGPRPGEARDQGPGNAQSSGATLAELIASQVTSPDTAAIAGPHLLTLAVGSTPGTEADAARTRASLDEAITELRAHSSAASSEPAPTDSVGEPTAEALAAYARGRWKLLGNDAAGAVADLEQATRLDPNSPAPWRSLGEAQWNSGRRSSAIQSFQRAVELGLREPRPLLIAGTELVRTGKRRDGLALLVRARDLAQDDPIFLVMIEVDTAQAMWSDGYRAAGLTMLRPALATLERTSPTDRRRPELAELYRRRGELWMRAGEWALLQGDVDGAVAAFESASRTPLPDPEALALRRTDSLLRAGRSGEAARLIVDRIGELGGRVGRTDAEMIAHIARHTRVASALSAELATIQRELPPTTPARTRAGLARAIASTQPPDDALRTLARAINEGGDFEPLLVSMLDTVQPRQPAPIETEASQATRADAPTAPASAGPPALTPQAASAQARDAARVLALSLAGEADRARTAATVLLLRGRLLSQTLDELAGSSSADARACGVHLALALGSHERAMRIAAQESGTTPPMLIARAWASVRSGRFADARAAIAELDATVAPVEPSTSAAEQQGNQGGQGTQGSHDPSHSQGLIRERALILAELGQLDEAIGSLEVGAASGADPSTLVTLGELRLRVGDAAGARRALERAREIDPGEEAAASLLLSLHGQRGALPDPARLTALVRELRTHRPDATLLRVEQSRELAGRGSLAQAAALLAELTLREPEPTGVVPTLAAIWERAGRTTPDLAHRGEAWLRAQLAERPDAPLLLIAHARVLASLDRTEEAEGLLAGAFERWPITELGIAREALVAETLKEPERARTLTRARLAAAPPTPANVIELADVLLGLGMPDEAGKALSERLAPDAPLNAVQLARLETMLAGIRAEAFSDDPAGAAGALSLFDRLASRGVVLTPDLSLKRARLVALSSPLDTQAILAAIDLVARGLASGPGAGVVAEPRRATQARFAAGVAVAESLAAIKDATPLLRLLGALAQRDATRDSASDAILYEWYRLTFVRGELDDCLELINGVQDPARLVEVLVSSSDGQLEAADGVEPPRVVIAYALASAAHTFERIDLAEALYRHALSIAPDHAWTNNNLGYLLLEEERDLAEAQRLIERAHAKLSDEASVVDSLAWVRYKLGHIDDHADASGANVEGAMTLLERAISLGGMTNHTILDHFGDALWRSDRPIEAQRAWSQARIFVQMMLDNFERERADQRRPDGGVQPPLPDPSHIQQLRVELALLSRKLDAASNGEVPPLAPFAKGINDPLLNPASP